MDKIPHVERGSVPKFLIPQTHPRQNTGIFARDMLVSTLLFILLAFKEDAR